MNLLAKSPNLWLGYREFAGSALKFKLRQFAKDNVMPLGQNKKHPETHQSWIQFPVGNCPRKKMHF